MIARPAAESIVGAREVTELDLLPTSARNRRRSARVRCQAGPIGDALHGRARSSVPVATSLRAKDPSASSAALWIFMSSSSAPARELPALTTRAATRLASSPGPAMMREPEWKERVRGKEHRSCSMGPLTDRAELGRRNASRRFVRPIVGWRPSPASASRPSAVWRAGAAGSSSDGPACCRQLECRGVRSDDRADRRSRRRRAARTARAGRQAGRTRARPRRGRAPRCWPRPSERPLPALTSHIARRVAQGFGIVQLHRRRERSGLAEVITRPARPAPPRDLLRAPRATGPLRHARSRGVDRERVEYATSRMRMCRKV